MVKVGSSVLTTRTGRLDPKALRRLASQIGPLIGRRLPCVVSSGSIAVGVGALDLAGRPRTMAGLQAAAAVGQSKLVEAWGRALRPYQAPVAQVLLTHADLEHRGRFLNARRALGELQRRGALPIINENDCVSFDEIAFGDNDVLAAQVANLVDADVLLLVSVSDGFADASGERVPVVAAHDPNLDAWIRPERSAFGSGGMTSKLAAVRAAAERGAHVLLVDGRQSDALTRALAGDDIGTLFVPPSGRALRSRAHWIAHTLRPRGSVVVDEGAARALRQQRSLLPRGIVRVTGDFSPGDCVDIRTEETRRPLARGLVRYSAPDLDRIVGLESRRIAPTLGFSAGDEAVHRDDLVILGDM